MKTINSLLTTLLLTASVCCTQQANAQAPQKMSYQSVLRNSSNVLLADTQVGIKISVLQGGALGNAVYTETQTPTTNANGLVSLQIGTGANQTGTFAGINWANGPYFIKTETDPSGGTNYTITGSQEILSVPYALNGITKAQADAIVSMQAQIADLKAQSNLVIPTVTIGTQDWTKYNLNVTTYSNGDIIPEVQSAAAWEGLTTGAWCHYNNDPANDAIYGKLYNWYAVTDPRGITPSGFHVPSDGDWTTLTDFLGNPNFPGDIFGNQDLVGGKMKSTGTSLWASPNAEATNESGFTGLPGGRRSYNGSFTAIGSFGAWWSLYELSSMEFGACFLNSDDGRANRIRSDQTNGFSVRCLRD